MLPYINIIFCPREESNDPRWGFYCARPALHLCMHGSQELKLKHKHTYLKRKNLVLGYRGGSSEKGNGAEGTERI